MLLDYPGLEVCSMDSSLPVDDSLDALLRKVLLRADSKVQTALVNHALAHPEWAITFGITADTVEEAIADQVKWLPVVRPAVERFCCDRLGWSTEVLHQRDRVRWLWTIWLPLARQMAAAPQRPLIQGILGGQGTGKTTLAAVLTVILQQMGLSVCSLSIDDLYKTYAERQILQRADPRLKWRGPPGTHDVDLGISVLQQLREGEQPVALPRFDKSLWAGSGDRTQPQWIERADIVLFEGWFVGARPVPMAVFDQAPDPISSEGDRQFARDMNHALAAYEPLWNYLDRLMVLIPTDYRLSLQWRKEAEHRMIASGRSGMSDEEIEAFVTYFWRSLHPQIFIEPMCQRSDVDMVMEILPDHRPRRIYSPRDRPSSPAPVSSPASEPGR